MKRIGKKSGGRRRGSGKLTITGGVKGVFSFLRQNWLVGVVAIGTAAIAAVVFPKKDGKTNWTAVALAGIVPIVAQRFLKRQMSGKQAIAASTIALGMLYVWDSGLRAALMGNKVTSTIIGGSEKLAYTVKGYVPNGGTSSAPASYPSGGQSESFFAPTYTSAPSAPQPSSADTAQQYVTIAQQGVSVLGDLFETIGIAGNRGGIGMTRAPGNRLVSVRSAGLAA
ncbi:MAG: hypothetical protein L6Q71_10900 [Planctomycetes bacterium]|nr:hypothetical protein [Planctomycetota bacterium]NUQ33359.1 hypothetical protein [Planctomycetaceae bacterium]